MLFREAASKWLEEEIVFIKQSTIGRYEVALHNHLLPVFGEIEMSEMRAELLQNAVNDWKSNGRLDGKGGLKHSSVRDLVALYKQIVQYYYRITGNVIAPSWRVRNPVNQEKSLNVLSKAEYKRLVTYISNKPNRTGLGVLLALQLGLRIGEVCGLRWGFVDLNKRTIRIEETVQRIYRKGEDGVGHSYVISGSPKTLSSRRELPIPESLFKILSSLCREDKTAPGDTKQVYLLTGQQKPIEPRALRARYNTLIAHIDMRYVSFHSLRHSFASRMVSCGVGEKTTSAILGHASVQVTLDYYVHPQLDDKRKAIHRCFA